jgi:hypothetical protein
MFGPLGSLAPELVWGLFTRGLGLVLLISFGSLSRQMVAACGQNGPVPIGIRLRKIAEDFPTWRRFLYFPTLLWVSHRDGMLRALPLIGMAAAAVVIYGGPLSMPALLVCYVCYLSLDFAIGLIFPWDCLAFEATLLALLLPATHPLPELAAVAAPAPALAWAYRLLVFRVMFGFGKQKFIGSTGKDLAYLKGFLASQPLPSPLGWYAQHLPVGILRLMVLFMFLAEIPIPFFAFVPGDLSIVCALSTIFLMIGIQAMGSFGYFSLLTIAVCIPLFDNVTPTQLRLDQLFAPGAPIAANTYVLVHTLAACITFPWNSWIAQSWLQWSFWYRLPRLLQLPLDLMRLLHPFRWVHPYGVFPPNNSPSVKMSLLLEVTWDRKTWHEEEFAYSPSHARSAPKFVAPHHPRGDQAVIYETFGLNPMSLISSVVGPWDPYAHGSQPAAKGLAQSVVEGRGLVFLKGDVLASREEPPVSARLTTVMLEPVSVQEHLQTGVWWKRTYVGPHTPPHEFDPRFWQDYVPEPEMWHFDAIFWRRRSKLAPLMERAREGSEDPLELALAGAPELTRADIDRFWDELVPMVGLTKRNDWDTLADVVPAVRARFSPRDLRALQRVLGRLSLVLIARLEPLYLGRGLSPEIPAKTYFHLWMLAQHILGNGRQAYLDAVANPRGVTAELERMTLQSGLYYLCIFRFDSMVFDAWKLRLIWSISPPHDLEAKRRVAYSAETMGKAEQFLAKVADATAGYFSLMPYLRDAFLGPRFDHGFPEMYPVFEQLPSGEVVVREYGKPAQGAKVAAASRAADAPG